MSERTDATPTDEEIFIAWRRAINRDRSNLRKLTDKLALADRQRAELRAKLARVQEYANYFCMAWHTHLAGDVAPLSFDEWLADAEKPVQP
jgi:hypothetical protein